MQAWHEAAAFLSIPGSYGLSDPVQVIDTSISKIYLAGTYAYKIRKPVKLSYLDFSSLEQRRQDCEREVELNRRTAPSIYLGVIAVTRDADNKLSLDGKGQPIEWVVKMRRFDNEALLENMAEDGRIDSELIAKLARNIAAFHEAIAPEYEPDLAENFRSILIFSDAEFRDFSESIFPAPRIDALRDASLTRLDALAPIMHARKAAGWVRHCHGDLHLGNIFCLDGEPVPFDCIEFNDTIAKIDILYDLAFLLMDLWQRGLKQQANHCLNQYLTHLTLEHQDACITGLALLPLYLCCRAGVRAFVMARTSQSLPGNAALIARAQHYFTLAQSFLQPPPAKLIAVSGLSGSGKSVLARALASMIGAAPGAVILRSDEIRKKLAGRPLLEALPPDAYTQESSTQVYACILDRARKALQAGHSVIADAVFARAAERDAIEAVARDLGAPFQGLWLSAPQEVLLSRVGARRNDASDANAAVVQQQSEYDTGNINWTSVDAGGTPQQTLERALIKMR